MFGRPNAPVTLLKVRSPFMCQLAVAVIGRRLNERFRFRMYGTASTVRLTDECDGRDGMMDECDGRHGMMSTCYGKDGMMNECDGDADSNLGPCSVGRTRR